MISSETQRVLFKANSGAPLVDVSDDLNNFRIGTADLTLETTGRIYIGQYLPFVSRYFDLSAVNSNAASLTIDVWDGSNWRSTVDLRDRTKAGLITMAKSGYVDWRIDRYDQAWSCQDKSKEVDGLEQGPQIYDYHWLRITVDTDMSAVTFKHIGNLFSTDSEMYSHYPALDDQTTRDQWNRANPGTKTTWLEQGFIAAEFIIRDLKTRNIILEDGQVFDVSKFNLASIHKQANIIYGGLGRGFKDQQDASEKAYQKAMSLGRLNIDSCADGVLRGRERMISTGFATR